LISKQLIDEFIKALDEEIKALKEGKGGTIVKIFDGHFIRKESKFFIYSFKLENFITTIDDTPVEVKVDSSRYEGEIIQTRELEVIIGIKHDFGKLIPEAKLIIKLYFLYELLKKKFEAIRNGQLHVDFTLANLVFEGKTSNVPSSTTIPPLESHVNMPNQSQLEAIKKSQSLPLSFIWGPPGTGKTKTLARIVECFLKQGMRILVVAHSNAAVDEATEDIAEILKNTEYYTQGQIIRLGNYQKHTLETKYNFVIFEEIVEKLAETLKRKKEVLEECKNRVEQKLKPLTSVWEDIQKREALLGEVKQLINIQNSIEKEITGIRTQIAQWENDLDKLRIKLHKAKSSGILKRFFLGLNPEKIQQEINQLTVLLNDTQNKLHERKLKLQEIKYQRSVKEKDIDSLQQRTNSLLKNLGLSKERIEIEIQKLIAEKKRISDQIKEIQNELNKLPKHVLSKAKVICTTLTKTFSAQEFPDTPFDVLVVDEASMAPMPYLYWALGRCRKSAVIVGDFLQLPPICVSESNIAKKWLGRNIYQHLHIDTPSKAKRDKRVCLLDTQYRMNPAISSISNEMFYEGLLKDDTITHTLNMCDGLSEFPLTIIDTTSASPWCSRLRSGSRFNIYHALLAVTAAKKILENKHYEVGIITPYTAQTKLIRKIAEDMKIDRIHVATVHRFQGGETDIVIFDTVESPGVKIAPMLGEVDKKSDTACLLNVAITRAKYKIFLIANLQYLLESKNGLHKNALLREIIRRFKNNGKVIDCKKIVNSYFIRDFEHWITRLLNSFRSDVIEPPNGSLFTEKNFYPVFFEDLRNAKKEIIIFSPFVSVRRSVQFAELFRILIQKGIKIKLFTRPIKEQKSNFALDAAKVIEQMRKIGVEVIERKRMHQKIAIIDKKIAWEGSLNILSHRDSHEQMRRLPYIKAVNELIRLCEIDELSTESIHNKIELVKTFEQCPKCGEYMIIKIGKYGPFLVCPNPHCSKRRSIKKWDRIKTHILCPKCGHPMVFIWGSKGSFLGCSGYPKCKVMLPYAGSKIDKIKK